MKRQTLVQTKRRGRCGSVTLENKKTPRQTIGCIEEAYEVITQLMHFRDITIVASNDAGHWESTMLIKKEIVEYVRS